MPAPREYGCGHNCENRINEPDGEWIECSHQHGWEHHAEQRCAGGAAEHMRESRLACGCVPGDLPDAPQRPPEYAEGEQCGENEDERVTHSYRPPSSKALTRSPCSIRSCAPVPIRAVLDARPLHGAVRRPATGDLFVGQALSSDDAELVQEF